MALLSASLAWAQDWIKTGTGLGVEKIRLAVPDFKASTQDPKNADLLNVFNDILWNDLDNAGIFDMVSKSFYPLAVGDPEDVKFGDWSAPPPNASMLAFGNLGVNGANVTVQGWLYDVKNVTSPQVLGKQYQDTATTDAARTIAHKFADEIIFRLGGGIHGIAESKIFFVSSRSGHKEIWEMDYDGNNQRQITHVGSISLVAADFAGWFAGGVQFADQKRLGHIDVLHGSEPAGGVSPVWRHESFPGLVGGWHQAGFFFFPHRRSRDLCGEPVRSQLEAHDGVQRPGCFSGMEPEDRRANCVGKRAHRPAADLHYGVGRHQRAAAHRPGLRGVAGVAPNGQYLAFSWIRHYGPGAPGADDIYLMDTASKQWVQLTHDGGRNDFPSWSPDGRHIVFQSSRSGSEQIWTMLADGTNQKQLTFTGSNTQPNWSWK